MSHLEILCDHRQRALKDSFKDARDLALHLLSKLVDNSCKQT